MHQDKKREELEEIKELEREKMLDKEDEVEIEEETDEKENNSEQKIETVEGEIETDEVLEKKKRREVIFEMALFLILGILLGVTIKTEAVKRITIGFNDYQLSKSVQRYDIDKMKKDLEAQAAAQQALQEAQQQSPQ